MNFKNTTENMKNLKKTAYLSVQNRWKRAEKRFSKLETDISEFKTDIIDIKILLNTLTRPKQVRSHIRFLFTNNMYLIIFCK